MTKQQGIATIPLLFGLLLLVAVPLTIKQVQQNQNLQNRAASYTCLKIGEQNCFQTPCCDGLICSQGICLNPSSPPPSQPPQPTRPANQIPCSEINRLISTYCQNPGSSPPSGYTRCQDLIATRNNYCQTSSTPIPTTRTCIPTATIPTGNPLY